MNQENYQTPNLQQSLGQENVQQTQSNQELNQTQPEKNEKEEKGDFPCEPSSSNVIEENKTNVENTINDEMYLSNINERDTFSTLQPNEKVININYDISYTPSQNSYEQYLINKDL
jgi:hypothetical protein